MVLKVFEPFDSMVSEGRRCCCLAKLCLGSLHLLVYKESKKPIKLFIVIKLSQYVKSLTIDRPERTYFVSQAELFLDDPMSSEVLRK